jgi:hypothetical protein
MYGKSPGQTNQITWFDEIQINIILKRSSSDNCTDVSVLNHCHNTYKDSVNDECRVDGRNMNDTQNIPAKSKQVHWDFDSYGTV